MTVQKSITLLAAMLAVTAGFDSKAQAEDLKSLIDRQTQLDAEPVTPPAIVPYSYLVTIAHVSTEGDTEKKFRTQYRVNPQAEPGNRLSFINGGLETLPKDFQKEITKFNDEKPVEDIAEDFWCSGTDGTRISDRESFSVDNLNIVREDENMAVIALDTAKIKEMMRGGDDDDEMPKKLLKRLAAEVTVSKPELAMEHMRIWLTKPTTVKLIAKLKAMEIEQSCDKAPNGFYYVATNNSRVQAKALGKSVNADTTIVISDLLPLD